MRNPFRRRSAAQNAAVRAMKRGRRRAAKPEPFGRIQSGGLFGMRIKVMPDEYRALIDEYLSKA